MRSILPPTGLLIWSKDNTFLGRVNYQIPKFQSHRIPGVRSCTEFLGSQFLGSTIADLMVSHFNLLLSRLSRASRLLNRATIRADWHHPGGRFLDMKEAGAAFQVEQPKPLTPTATPLPDSYPTPWIHKCHSHKSHKIQW